jgi:predicted aspartyl protease
VILHGPGGTHGKTWAVSALVDTGADYMHLPESAATAVGISLTRARRVKTSTAGGTVVFRRCTVDVEIENVKVSIPVNFGRNLPALIGRQAMFSILEIAGFSTTEWLLKWLPPDEI